MYKILKLPKRVKISWKMAELRCIKCNFIIRIDVLNYNNIFVNIVDGQISFNGKITNFTINPYYNLQVCKLEGIGSDWKGIQLDHLNSEEHRDVLNILKRFEK